jgi:uncharacterized protein (DUF1499 family)
MPGGGGPKRTVGGCGERPNCVSSEARDEAHRVEAFPITASPEAAWAGVREVVAALPRTRIAAESPGYLRAECRSRLFRFVDDLELELLPGEQRIAVRSASRVGYSDLGVNRRRVEDLRSALRGRGLIR